MRVQDLVLVAQKIRVVTQFRGTMGLRGRLSTRLQPNHPTDEPAGIAASGFDSTVPPWASICAVMAARSGTSMPQW